MKRELEKTGTGHNVMLEAGGGGVGRAGGRGRRGIIHLGTHPLIQLVNNNILSASYMLGTVNKERYCSCPTTV